MELPTQKDAGISSLHFCPFDNGIMATTSWKGTIDFLAIELKQIFQSWEFPEPLLCGAWVNSETVASGSVTGKIFISKESPIDGHSDGVSSLFMIPESQTLVSTSWDRTLKVWDMASLQSVGTVAFKDKILCAEVSTNSRIIAHGSNNFVYILDIRNPDQVEKRVSSLGNQIRSSCASRPLDYGWAIGSIDGRIAIEYFGDVIEQAQRFSFSCNKRSESEKVIVYPVNALTFHPKTGILTSGSCNGDICFWDVQSKRKLGEMISQYDVSVASLDYNSDGSRLAVAFSYTWDKGDIPHNDDRIVIYSPPRNYITPRGRDTE